MQHPPSIAAFFEFKSHEKNFNLNERGERGERGEKNRQKMLNPSYFLLSHRAPLFRL
jgi:hypothetical protein